MEIISVLQSSPFCLAIVVGLLGLCVGSLLNVVIHRLPKMMQAQWREECAALDGREQPLGETYNLFTPRSACPQCKAPISALQNVPAGSWLVLRAKCANCKAPMSARYPLVEVLGGALAVLAAWRFGYSAALAFALVYMWVMLALTFIDLDTQLLPDDLTLPLLWAGLIANAFGVFTDLHSAVLGAAGGYMVLWSGYWAFRLITRKEGMGFGDFKLLAAIGARAGWPGLPVALIIPPRLGAVVGSLLLWLAKKGSDTRIPFGPYLALGGIASLLWGREAVSAWGGRFPL